MTIYSCSTHPVLTCVLFNTAARLDLHDEDLHQHQFEGLRRLLRPSGGSLKLGEPPCPVQLSWMGPQHGSRPGRLADFMICRAEEPLLIAGLAADQAQSARLWDWLVFLKRRTFRCLDAPPAAALTSPGSCPWLGLVLMPGALGLSNDHLDALCGLGQTVGQVWLRDHFRAGEQPPRRGQPQPRQYRAPLDVAAASSETPLGSAQELRQGKSTAGRVSRRTKSKGKGHHDHD